MRKFYTILLSILVTTSVFAQTPQKLSYQAVIRNTEGELVKSSPIGMRISILKGSSEGPEVYVETHIASTNINGLVSIEIGAGAIVSGTIESIEWASEIYFIKTETDVTGGTGYTITGVSQILSVPYALFAQNADTAKTYFENDPVFTLHPSYGISSGNISNWSTAYSWGNHATKGYLTSFTETDPKIGANTTDYLSKWNGIALVSSSIFDNGLIGIGTNNPATRLDVNGLISATGGNSGEWNTAYNWGDHAGLYRPIGYVPAWGEITSNPFTITTPTTDQLLKYNGANWVNYTPSFLITEVDGSVTNEIQNLASVLTEGNDAANKTILNVSQQGIGTSTPNSSAILDLNSSTKGFLPPRMTIAQRDAITPVEGLIVYNTSTKKPNYYDGIEWKKFDGTSAQLVIGDSYQGGKVAYILQPGDPGYITGETHGLIAAPSDQSSGVQWGCNETLIGADGTAIGTGNQNTLDIIGDCLEEGIAARICNDLELNDYNDWYLPSKDELNKLYINKAAIGGFTGDAYWSSSEYSSTGAWYQYLTDGDQYGVDDSKNGSAYTRAVRTF